MRIIGFAGKSGAGKTTAAAMTLALLAEQGYTAKLESFALPVRMSARERFGVVEKTEARTWMQETAEKWLNHYPDSFLRQLHDRNIQDLSTDFLVIHDVRRRNEVNFCRQSGVVVYIQGTHRPLDGPAAEHSAEDQSGELFHGADYIITRQPSLPMLAAAVKAMIKSGGHLRRNAPASDNGKEAHE